MIFQWTMLGLAVLIAVGFVYKVVREARKLGKEQNEQ